MKELGWEAAHGESRVEMQYDSTTGTVGEVETQAAASISATGSLKAVDLAQGTITLTTASGADLTLNATSKSRLLLNGSLTTLASLKGLIGSEVTIEYDQQTKAVGELNARARAESIAGTLKSVNAAAGTITIATAGGADLELKVTSDTKVVLNGVASSMVAIATQIGGNVTAEYNAQTQTATSAQVQSKSLIPVP